jgi:hypothetical protein
MRDMLFLAAVVVLSCLPYLRGLGLYSDDWAFLSALHNTDGSYLSLLAAVMPMELATRPVQGLVLAALYSLFGLEPFGYHVANSAVLVAAVLLLYLSLRALGVPRSISVSVPLVFGLLPHYSTDRFWIAAFQANVSICLYFLSLYADLRFITRSGGHRWSWKILGAIAMLGSVLAYEVTAPLFLLNVLVLFTVGSVRRQGKWAPEARPTMLGGLANIAILAVVIGYKLTTTVRADISGGYLYRLLRIAREAAPVHFGEYGLALPVRVGQVLRDYPDYGVLGVSLLVGLIVHTYFIRIVRPTAGPFPRPARWPVIMLLGSVLFAVGYGVSLTTWEIGFHTTGANNRTAVAAAIGVSFVFVGALGWISSWPRSDQARWAVFSVLTALLAASGTMVTNTVAGFWVRAARQQQTVIYSIRQQLPNLAPGSTLLIDGLCPFVGPAPVFATGWDVSGMLQLSYGERSLRGDVVKPNTEVTPTGVLTTLFDDVISLYPYRDGLIVYHLTTEEVFRLNSLEAARRYFEDVSLPSRPACPPYTDGDGTPVF